MSAQLKSGTKLTPPVMPFDLVAISGAGFPVENNEAYQMMIDQAVSGGSGTANYLSRMLEFAQFTNYLNGKGSSAFSQQQMPDGSMQALATDGTTTMNVGVQLNPNLDESLIHGMTVRGIATVRLALPAPGNIAKFVSFGLSLAEIPAGIVVTNTLVASLFQPLLQQLTSFVQTTVDQWLQIGVGADIAGLGEEVASAADAAAEEVGAETAELLVEELVVAEVVLDLTAAVPAFAALGLLLAVPILISAMAKNFQLHLEIDNQTNSDFTWEQAYLYNGAMTAQPADCVLPRMGRATDAWGDETNIPVIYQANFSSMNKSGYEGTGIALKLSPSDLSGQDFAVLISIPWVADNALWVGDATADFDWEHAFSNFPVPELSANHGNQRFYASVSLDALSGNQDNYHCVLRIQSL